MGGGRFLWGSLVRCEGWASPVRALGVTSQGVRLFWLLVPICIISETSDTSEGLGVWVVCGLCVGFV